LFALAVDDAVDDVLRAVDPVPLVRSVMIFLKKTFFF
jgi:hypothetical protein